MNGNESATGLASASTLPSDNLPRLLITGCPRSGTRYLWRYLRCLGWHTGHERPARDAMVSWSAAVYDPNPPFGAAPPANHQFQAVWQVVRDPRSTIGSLAYSVRSPKSRRFAARHIRLPTNVGVLLQAVYWYVGWTRLAGRQSTNWFKIEEASERLPQLLRQQFGCEFGPRPQSQNWPSEKCNTRGPHPTPSWDQLRDWLPAALWAEVERLASMYEYL